MVVNEIIITLIATVRCAYTSAVPLSIPQGKPIGYNLSLFHNLPLNVRDPKLLSPPPWFICRVHKSIAGVSDQKL